MESWDLLLLLAAPRRPARNTEIPGLSLRSWECDCAGLVLGPPRCAASTLSPTPKYWLVPTKHWLVTGERRLWAGVRTWASEELRDCMEEGCEMWRWDVVSCRRKWEERWAWEAVGWSRGRLQYKCSEKMRKKCWKPAFPGKREKGEWGEIVKAQVTDSRTEVTILQLSTIYTPFRHWKLKSGRSRAVCLGFSRPVISSQGSFASLVIGFLKLCRWKSRQCSEVTLGEVQVLSSTEQ